MTQGKIRWYSTEGTEGVQTNKTQSAAILRDSSPEITQVYGDNIKVCLTAAQMILRGHMLEYEVRHSTLNQSKGPTAHSIAEYETAQHQLGVVQHPDRPTKRSSTST
jgi:hypothetical protein